LDQKLQQIEKVTNQNQQKYRKKQNEMHEQEQEIIKKLEHETKINVQLKDESDELDFEIRQIE
jgi:hypothetical protein